MSSGKAEGEVRSFELRVPGFQPFGGLLEARSLKLEAVRANPKESEH